MDTLVLGPNFTLLMKVKRSLPARSSTPTAARRLRASAYCESGKLCLQSHPLVPVSSAREPLCTTTVLLVLVDSLLAFALKVFHILAVVYS